MVSREEVIYAYRFFLCRNPENEAVINRLLDVSNWVKLREHFVNSTEFKEKSAVNTVADRPIEFPNLTPNLVDVAVSDNHFALLIAHVHESWETLGREQPHWSVLTNPKFLPDNIESNIDSFYETGESSVHILEKAAARAGKKLSSDWTCFELGCGVGRVTSRLVTRFKHVLAADISHPHLAIASEHLKAAKTENAAFLQIKSLETLKNLEPFDIFYSIIVLQHNPPPLIFRMLQLILAKVRMGGCVYFQVPVASPDYLFSIDDYLSRIAKGEGTMEMHMLPQVYLFRLLDEQGFRMLDFQRDNWTGPGFHSVTVFAEKIR